MTNNRRVHVRRMQKRTKRLETLLPEPTEILFGRLMNFQRIRSDHHPNRVNTNIT